jgi:phage-related protein
MEWANTSATAMGLPKQAALDAVGTIGNLFMQLGASSDQAANVGQGMVQLSADLASFHNVAGGSAEVLDAMSAAFRGEYDALQRYIPTINGAAVEQQALAMTGKESAKELTNLEKAMAVQAIMARDAGAAVGDFARTSDGAANQQRILDANMANLQATLGQGLLPIYGAFINTLNQLVQQVMPPVTAFITDKMVPAMDAIGKILQSSVGPMIETAKGWFRSLGETVQGQASGPLNFFNQWIAQNMPRIQQVVQTVMQALTQFWEQHGERITAIVQNLFGWLTMFWETQFRTILNIVQAALQLLTGDFEGAGRTLQNILNDWKRFFETVIRGIVNGIRTWFREVDWGSIGRGILEGIASGLRNGGSFIADAARSAAQGAFDAARNLLGIRSPSKLAAEGIGKPFAEGIGEGIRSSLADLTGGVNAGLQGLMGGITTPTAGAAAGGSIALRSAGLR